jgi:hypothetical protein
MRADGLLEVNAKRKANRRASFVRVGRVRLSIPIVTNASSRVQRRAALRCTAYVCLQALVVGAVTTISGLSFAEPDSTQVPSQPPAADTSPAALVAARELFRQATADADAGRHAAALDKFQRVAKIRESAAVRFNIGQCEERLGRIGSALASYELAEQHAQRETHGEEIIRMARAAAEPLRARAPRLTLVAGPSPPKDLTVALDGAPLPSASLGVALPVDPGDHVVDAEAAGHARRHWTLTLAEGHAETIDVALVARVEGGLGPALTGASTASDADRSTLPEPRSTSWWTTRRALGASSLGLGAAAGVVSVVFVLGHNGAVRELRTACEGGCPESRRTELSNTRDTAVRDQTVAVTAGIVAGVALATGAVLLLWPTHEVRVTASSSSVGLAGVF